jgi:nicotinamide-nucleotide amidase
MSPPTDVELQQLAGAVGRHLVERTAKLVTAESCSGGWIAKVCTDLAGSSEWFSGGIVAYANSLKTALLGVPEALLAEHGAVSEPVVRAMAQAALQRAGAEVSVAVSGVAGPTGGTPQKPVGTVWLAWAWRAQDGTCRVESQLENFPGDRETVRRLTVQRALQRLLDA